MGGALLRGWLAESAPVIRVIDPLPGADVRRLAEGRRVCLNPPPGESDVVVLGVKPQQFSQAAEAIRAFCGRSTRVISIMAGVRIEQLVDRLGVSQVVRAMPNTPGAIGRGVTVFAAPATACPEDLALARTLLAPLGEVHGPVDEALMPAVTALSGSGPAYVFLLAELMAKAGEAQGLPPALSARLARRTVEGAGALLSASADEPAALRQAVTSPGGTTQAALDVLTGADAMEQLIGQAIAAAARRDRELSGEAG